MADYNERTAVSDDPKEAVQEIRERLLFIKNVFDGIDSAVFVVGMAEDGEFRYICANAAFERMTSLKSADIIGKRPEDVYKHLHNETARNLRTNFFHCIASGSAVDYNDVIIQNGHRIWIKTHLTPLPGIVSKSHQIIGTFTDISEFKMTEEILRENEKKFTLLFDHMTNGFALHDVLTDSNGFTVNYVFRDVNKAFEKIMQLERKNIIGKKITDVMSKIGGNDFNWIKIYREIALKGDAATQEHYFKSLNKWLCISAFNPEEGKYATIFSDITTSKHLESQFLQAQKMESVGRLAGGVAHDFNNMLTVIIGNSDMVLSSLTPDNTLYDDITEIKSTAERATGLTKQLLAFSRQQDIEPQVINLNTVLSDMDKMLRRLIGEDIELVTFLADKLNMVRVDPGQIVQVLTNLAVNARDAMPDGGMLTLETANVILDIDYTHFHCEVVPGSYVMIAVSDTGTGIDEKTMSQIFEPFFTTKEKGKGTGLGLSTCYGIVKQNKGNIWVYSELGHGTTFKIYFPIVEAEPESVPIKKDETDCSVGGTILLVEDDELVNDMLSRILRQKGFNVHNAHDGLEMLNYLDKNKIEKMDLLVTDLVMPHMNGKELSARLRTLHPEIRVIYMSGYTDNSIINYGIHDGDGVFLQKPFSPETFIRKIRESLAS
ncbi:response regulator [bacterium]|nr:response regulator [bacterium]